MDPDPLAARLADGDLKAPRDLIERHYAELHRYALAMLRDGTAADEAVSETFERALKALGRYPDERIRAMSLRAWLYRITLNVVRNSLRNRAREVLVGEALEVLAHRTSELGEDHRAAWLDVLVALRYLPERQRIAVALRYLQDLPYAEIADATGWPVGTVKTLVRRGVGRLRVLLMEPDRKEVRDELRAPRP